MKKKSDSLNCSQELGDLGLGWKAVTEQRTEKAKEIRKKIKGKDFSPRREKEIIPRTDNVMNNLTASLTIENLLVSGQTSLTNMPVKSIGNNLEIRNSGKVILEKSDQKKFLTLTYLQQVFPVSLFPLPENVKVFKTSQGELYSLKSSELLEIKDQSLFYLRMSRDSFHMTMESLSRSYCYHWMNLGMMQNGKCLTLNIGCPKTGKGSLSLVLEDDVDGKYYLSKVVIERLFKNHPEVLKSARTPDSIAYACGANDFKGVGNKPQRNILYWKNSKEKWQNKTGNSPALKGQADLCRQPLLIHNKYGGFKEEKLRIFKNHSPSIRTPKGGGHLPDVVTNKQIRRLTPKECERLQGFPDGWTEGVSDTQRYKMMGNAVSIPVIEAIGKKMLKVFDFPL